MEDGGLEREGAREGAGGGGVGGVLEDVLGAGGGGAGGRVCGLGGGIYVPAVWWRRCCWSGFEKGVGDGGG